MKTVTLNDVQKNLHTLISLVTHGETIAIKKGKQILALITSPKQKHEKLKKFQHVDFAAQRRAIFGDRVLPDSMAIIDELRRERF